MLRMRTIGTAVAACLALLTTTVRAEETTYDLRGPAAKKGTVYNDATLTKIKDATVTARIGQAELKLGTASVDGDKKSEVEILAVRRLQRRRNDCLCPPRPASTRRAIRGGSSIFPKTKVVCRRVPVAPGELSRCNELVVTQAVCRRQSVKTSG